MKVGTRDARAASRLPASGAAPQGPPHRARCRCVTRRAQAVGQVSAASKSHFALAIGIAVIHQGHGILYRKAYVLLENLVHAQFARTRKDYLVNLTAIPLLVISWSSR